MNQFSDKPIISNNDNQTWDVVIRAKRNLFDIGLGEIWKHRDLLYMFAWRDFVILYKQTILGPLWIFLQPILTMSVYVIIFSRIIKIPTAGVPPALFYLSGIIIWNYFTHCLNKTASTFQQNSNIYDKVYFPRLIMPISKILSGLINLVVQILLLILVIISFILSGKYIHINSYIIMVPYLLFLTGALGLGLGLIISALTITYRDLVFIVGFGVQLLMYASAVIYPVSVIPENYRSVILWNPVVHILEAFRYSILGTGEHATTGMFYTSAVVFVILITGIVFFNRMEQTFIDTV